MLQKYQAFDKSQNIYKQIETKIQKNIGDISLFSFAVLMTKYDIKKPIVQAPESPKKNLAFGKLKNIITKKENNIVNVWMKR